MGVFLLLATMVKPYCYHGRVSETSHKPRPRTATWQKRARARLTHAHAQDAPALARKPARDRPGYN